MLREALIPAAIVATSCGRKTLGVRMINDQLQLVFLLKKNALSQRLLNVLNRDYACLYARQFDDPLSCDPKKNDGVSAG
ncbi:hypothetical protein ACFO3I_14395 [Rheinheimera marina]|uniref:Uncharacterized protein n=1 Tax=Rheinheimera marina TaxID=1774958 RepID=A0ABV9JPK9_9GAMM